MPRSPDAQMPRSSDAQMPRSPDAQKPRCPDAKTPRCPDVHQSRTTRYFEKSLVCCKMVVKYCSTLPKNDQKHWINQNLGLVNHILASMASTACNFNDGVLGLHILSKAYNFAIATNNRTTIGIYLPYIVQSLANSLELKGFNSIQEGLLGGWGAGKNRKKLF